MNEVNEVTKRLKWSNAKSWEAANQCRFNQTDRWSVNNDTKSSVTQQPKVAAEHVAAYLGSLNNNLLGWGLHDAWGHENKQKTRISWNEGGC